MNDTSIKFIYFGTPEFSADVLEELLEQNIKPELIVTAPDKPAGRNLVLTPPPVKLIAEKNNIPYIQPAKLNDEIISELKKIEAQIFVVVAYGKILRKNVLDLPEFGTINVHPSLLPKYRGPSPITAPILNGDTQTGVTIMILDEEVDHGPILAQEKIEIGSDENANMLAKKLAKTGGQLLAKTMKEYLAGEIIPQEQNHQDATFTAKVTKEDGEIDLNDDPQLNYRKFLAYHGWPGVYFFANKEGKKIRVIVKGAEFASGKFRPLRVIPEGKKEMDYSIFSTTFSDNQ